MDGRIQMGSAVLGPPEAVGLGPIAAGRDPGGPELVDEAFLGRPVQRLVVEGMGQIDEPGRAARLRGPPPSA